MKKKKDVLRFGHQRHLPDTSFVPVFVAATPTVVISPLCVNIKSLVSILKKHEEKKMYLGHKQRQMHRLCPFLSLLPPTIAMSPTHASKYR
jgi:hypothetical protein